MSEIDPARRNAEAPADVTHGVAAADSHAQTIGAYRLLQKVGEGGMGEVWRAEQLRPMRRLVAFKIIKTGMDTAQVVGRFEAERQALAIMDHQAIAKVFDGGATPDGRPYFVMEYVAGQALTAFCDRRRLTTRERLELFIQLCEGVQHAHQKGVIHRDLKPANVLVAWVNDNPILKIIDFGIAKATSSFLSDRSLYTEVGLLVGTPEYMSPEQADMSSIDVDTRSDIYSLGVMLYELLTGALPFDRDELRRSGLDDLRRTIREVDPPRPSTRLTRLGMASGEAAKNRQTDPRKLARQLRGDLDWITLKALEKDRARRYQTANALAMDLRRHLAHEPVTAGPPSALYRTRKFARRHRMMVGFAALVLVLLMAFLVVTMTQARRIERERAVAEQVSAFLVGLFQLSDPSQARGETVTVREILASAAGRIDAELKGQPEVRARLQTTLGEVYTTLGLYTEAEGLLTSAVATSEVTRGRDDPATLASMDALADVYWYQNRWSEAERIYREVIARRRRVFGPNGRETLKAQFDLASVFINLKDRWQEAEQLILETLAAQRSALGHDDPDTLSTINNLQALYFRQQRFGDALPLAREVLQGRQRLYGESHPDTLRAMHNIASVTEALGNVTEAERLFQRTIEGRRRILGEAHPDLASTMTRLAGLYVKAQRFADAEPLLIAAHANSVTSLGEGHERVAAIVRLLVETYRGLDDTVRMQEWERRLAATGPR